VTCLDVCRSSRGDGSEGDCKVATGWSDGTVRIFDLSSSEVAAAAASSSSSSSATASNLGLVHSLLHADEGGAGAEEFVTREPLVLNGHGSSPVRCVVFDRSGSALGGAAATRLASGGSDGAVVVWDIVAETGLFRLLGHSGAVTDISFIRPGLGSNIQPTASNLASTFDGLVTSSVEGLVKVWDLAGQCCVQTIANHRGEVSCSAAIRLGGSLSITETDYAGSDEGRWRLVTGCADGAVRVWSVTKPKRIEEDRARSGISDMNKDEQENGSGDDATVAAASSPDKDDACHFIGTLSPPPNVATSNEKVASIHFHPNGRYVGVCRINGKTIAVYHVRNEAEAQRKRTRRMRRRREKGGKKATGADDGTNKKSGKKRGILDDDESEDDNEQSDGADAAGLNAGIDPESIQASDEFEYITAVRASHKIKGFTFAPFIERGGGIRIICALATNALEVHSVVKKSEKVKGSDTTNIVYSANKLSTLDMYSHPTGVRSISLSSDDVLACTVSKSVTKVWNVNNRSCLRSLPLASSPSGSSSYYGLCSTFLPGNTHVVIGTREGHLLVLDVASGDIVYVEENAHDGAIWSLDLRRPNLEHDEPITIVTGSADKMVKFWDVERQEDAEEGAHHPMVVHTRSLQMSDDVVAVRYSYSMDPSQRMVFVSSLDCTIKVFFDDSLKFFLSLYGHKLPALALDAADDDTILATAGADKTIKIWGLDFGDTHRTLHGHTDSITDLKFVRKTHYFFTASKDGTIRYWDADRFEQILLLNGHAAEVSCLAVSRTGAYVLSGGMDRQIRVWERTKDMVFLEEERERELEAMFDEVDGSKGGDKGTAGILHRRRPGDDEDELDGDDDAAGDDQPQSEAAVRRSVLSVAAGDRIMEAIELADQETKDIATFNRAQKKAGRDEKRRPNPMLLGMEPPLYMLWVLRTVKSADLEQSLLVLPLNHMERLLYYLILLLRSGRGVELCSKIAVFLVKTHQSQVSRCRAGQGRAMHCIFILSYTV
jgi:U3 small nucleolar RNA-associated protein 12